MGAFSGIGLSSKASIPSSQSKGSEVLLLKVLEDLNNNRQRLSETHELRGPSL